MDRDTASNVTSIFAAVVIALILTVIVTFYAFFSHPHNAPTSDDPAPAGVPITPDLDGKG